MNTTQIGNNAERLVADYLAKKCHKILAMNWSTSLCEIDIVSKHKKCVYFTEVKYRSSSQWGTGFDYITAKKLKQIKFAAEIWIANNNWKGEALLQAAQVDSSGRVDLVELEI